MNRSSIRAIVLAVLALAVLSLLSCGVGSRRVLQSISVSPQTANGQVQYVATGTFSEPPIKVTPLAVNWCLQNPKSASPVGCPPSILPGITNQGLATCGNLTIQVLVIAEAPADPKLRLNTQGVPGVFGFANLGCP